MNLTIDCIALPKNFAGAAYYILNLALALLQSTRSYSVIILCKPGHSTLFSNLKENDKIETIAIKNRVQQLFFYEFQLRNKLKKLKTDIFLATHYITPKADTTYKIISIFHDAGFFLHPRFYPQLKRLYFKKRIPVFLKRSDKIVTVSNNTRNDLSGLFPGHKDKIQTIYPGTDHIFTYSTNSSYRLKKPFILAVNAFEPRKNIPFIAEVFKLLKEKYRLPHYLYLAGQNGSEKNRIESAIAEKNLNNFITLLTSPETAVLRQLYEQAEFFINASEYEGFGFTPFEAIKHGCPVFLFRNPVVAEIFKDHPYVFDNLDAEDWANRIFDAYQKGFKKNPDTETAQKLTWDRCAANFNQLLQTVK